MLFKIFKILYYNLESRFTFMVRLVGSAGRRASHEARSEPSRVAFPSSPDGRAELDSLHERTTASRTGSTRFHPYCTGTPHVGLRQSAPFFRFPLTLQEFSVPLTLHATTFASRLLHARPRHRWGCGSLHPSFGFCEHHDLLVQKNSIE
jgi:hypothetical protein